ncbi:hypothetical protein SAMN05192589_104251 [Paracidovorax valerianellae]|uniref:Uncharacterized protein n=1 Tax=Paracidovorax valerianellae TaxID=187868 RepID=A0A1G6RX82_9BURK|nr:hypothetical protein SAMN05192589_104251 [Paracidovorax valerianellae]
MNANRITTTAGPFRDLLTLISISSCHVNCGAINAGNHNHIFGVNSVIVKAASLGRDNAICAGLNCVNVFCRTRSGCFSSICFAAPSISNTKLITSHALNLFRDGGTALRRSQHHFRHLCLFRVILISRQSHSSQNTDNRHNDHQFNQGKTLLQIALHISLQGGRLHIKPAEEFSRSVLISAGSMPRKQGQEHGQAASVTNPHRSIYVSSDKFVSHPCHKQMHALRSNACITASRSISLGRTPSPFPLMQADLRSSEAQAHPPSRLHSVEAAERPRRETKRTHGAAW